MKSAKRLLTVAVLPVILLLTSCAKDMSLSTSTEQVLVRSKWGIEYHLNNQNLTPDFTNYNLLFGEDGKLICKNGTDFLKGSWQRKMDNNLEIIAVHFDTNNSTVKLLNADWVLATKTPNTFQFESDILSPLVIFTIRKL
jgi:hypothetical protein